MKYTLVRPCSKCPFRTDVPNYLHPERRIEIGESVTFYDQTFPCHETIDYNLEDYEEGDGVITNDTQHCASTLIMLEHMERPNQMMRIAERLGFYDRTKLDMDSPVFKNVDDFINHE